MSWIARRLSSRIAEIPKKANRVATRENILLPLLPLIVLVIIIVAIFSSNGPVIPLFKLRSYVQIIYVIKIVRMRLYKKILILASMKKVPFEKRKGKCFHQLCK